MMYKSVLEIGIIADTHGSLPSSIPDIFKKTDLILHAGDIDDENVLIKLREISPVLPVKGNMDSGKWANNLNITETLEIGGVSIYMLHNIENIDLAPEGVFDAVIFGHTHSPMAEKQNNVLFLNPGSASYPRANTNASVAILSINGKDIQVNFINL